MTTRTPYRPAAAGRRIFPSPKQTIFFSRNIGSWFHSFPPFSRDRNCSEGTSDLWGRKFNHPSTHLRKASAPSSVCSTNEGRRAATAIDAFLLRRVWMTPFVRWCVPRCRRLPWPPQNDRALPCSWQRPRRRNLERSILSLNERLSYLCICLDDLLHSELCIPQKDGLKCRSMPWHFSKLLTKSTRNAGTFWIFLLITCFKSCLNTMCALCKNTWAADCKSGWRIGGWWYRSNLSSSSFCSGRVAVFARRAELVRSYQSTLCAVSRSS